MKMKLLSDFPLTSDQVKESYQDILTCYNDCQTQPMGNLLCTTNLVAKFFLIIPCNQNHDSLEYYGVSVTRC